MVAKYWWLSIGGQVFLSATLLHYTLIHVGHSTIQKDDILQRYPLLSMTEIFLIDGERLFLNKFLLLTRSSQIKFAP